VIARYDATAGVLAAEPDYVYLSQGSTGIITGDIDQVRPTRKLTHPSGHTDVFRDLGTPYIDVTPIRVVVSQPDSSLARRELR
jgi:hypothetical protein